MATDVLFINPGNAQAIYQGLASTVAAIEPPTWALLLAESCRSQGNSVAILDATAAEILRFRDEAFIEYHSSEEFKQVILNKFGQESLNTINETLKYKLKRDLYN